MKAIIAEIRRRYEDPERKNQSIGVVTFNISQQTLIEDMLQEEYQKDAAFDKWANVGEETLFVKNLENVQGDERDVILFSIAFGPDAEGRLSLNFGPLNKEGGWKRLNVAVSRARTEMIVFTTMTEDMIDLKRTKSKGVEALKDFLKFAQKGRLLGEYVETRVQKEQGIMEHICQAITDAGYQYQMAVGHSKFKVDIAVVNPYNPDEYLLGIMLDGESYLQSANTRDREVAQISVLNGLGWELHRIWTMDWWDNRDKELSRLLRLLAERKEAAYQIYQDRHKNDSEEIAAAAEEPAVRVEPTEEVKETNRNIDVSYTDESAEGKSSDEMTLVQKPVSADPGYFVTQNPVPVIADAKVASGKNEPSDVIVKADHEEMEYRVEEYISADVEVTDLSTVDYIKKENLPLIADKMQRIVDAEAPIMYDRLVKKTLRAFHIARSSPQTLEATDKALKKVSARINKQAGVKFYWRRDQEPDQYRIYRSEANSSDKRSSDEICQQELKNAVCAALAEKGAQDKESLMKNAIRTMGYARSSPALTAAAEKGLKYGRRTGEIVQNEEKRFLLGN
ncbi:DUF3320 domain-containing protein [Hungatella sp. SL.1.14]|uniref:DUF3320 domain-containing protein n=1 Tax=Hungatella sp. SL.1.14 TaxID=2963703 RepID=UPI00210D863A|nr:DUF3320 domain-containing protein [Hungatella sp. SL.1.14]MCQ4830356.1 AAA domain-containing protein [Hungatella sp. SL.1.14]